MKHPNRPGAPKAINRRHFLLGAGALLPAGLLASRLAFAAPAAGKAGDARFVFVILRGALDGLAALPPVGDPAYAGLRGPMAVQGPRLDDTFGLHPSLGFLHEAWQARELLPMHAVATAYRERSHFDGQDMLEGGGLAPHALQSGWLNRALAAGGGAKDRGVALGANVPLVMRGPAEVSSWSPSKLANLRDETLQRLTDLYASDPVLGLRLADALASDAIASEAQHDAATDAAGSASMAMPGPAVGGPGAAPAAAPAATPGAQGQRGAGALTETIRAAAGFLRRDDGPRIAVLETTGWDTHANEGGSEGQLAGRLGALDAGLRELHTALGPVWKNTTVLLATEFGRTAASNGTRGTDHGTGAAAFLVGGAVRGGRVLADWPGLAPGALHEGRDLKPTLDLRAVIKCVLREQLGVGDRALDNEVFPGSAGLRRVEGLTRA
jgi:uncharacterized protein (DUF1501 family)